MKLASTAARVAAGLALFAAMAFVPTSAWAQAGDAARAAASEDTRFGLSEAERKAVFKELARALNRAARETRERFGAQYQSIEAAVYQDRLVEQYKAEIAAKHGLTRKQVMELVAEGYEKSWPLIH